MLLSLYIRCEKLQNRWGLWTHSSFGLDPDRINRFCSKAGQELGNQNIKKKKMPALEVKVSITQILSTSALG